MSRYIDADELKSTQSINRGHFNSMETIREWIDSAPTIDIVRCRECDYWYHDADCGMACDFTNMSQPEDGFCNWGVRKEGSE